MIGWSGTCGTYDVIDWQSDCRDMCTTLWGRLTTVETVTHVCLLEYGMNSLLLFAMSVFPFLRNKMIQSEGNAIPVNISSTHSAFTTVVLLYS